MILVRLALKTFGLDLNPEIHRVMALVPLDELRRPLLQRGLGLEPQVALAGLDVGIGGRYVARLSWYRRIPSSARAT